MRLPDLLQHYEFPSLHGRRSVAAKLSFGRAYNFMPCLMIQAEKNRLRHRGNLQELKDLPRAHHEIFSFPPRHFQCGGSEQRTQLVCAARENLRLRPGGAFMFSAGDTKYCVVRRVARIEIKSSGKSIKRKLAAIRQNLIYATEYLRQIHMPDCTVAYDILDFAALQETP